MRGEPRESNRWPSWLEPLRPDAEVRRRVAAGIHRRAAALLAARRRPRWHEVAGGWSSMLVPVAAVLLLFFGALAYHASADGRGDLLPAAGQPLSASAAVALEDLIGPEDPEGTFRMLTAASGPSTEGFLTAVMDAGSR